MIFQLGPQAPAGDADDGIGLGIETRRLGERLGADSVLAQAVTPPGQGLLDQKHQ